MDLKNLTNALGPLLARADNVYQCRRSREELMSLAMIFAEVLQEEMKREACINVLREAFYMHFGESSFFPKPAQILERIPHARISLLLKQRKTRPAPRPGGARTPGMGLRFYAAWKGDEEQRKYLKKMGYEPFWEENPATGAASRLVANVLENLGNRS